MTLLPFQFGERFQRSTTCAVILLASVTPAQAALLDVGERLSGGGLSWGLSAIGLALAGAFALRAKRSSLILQTAKRKLGEVEYQLNQAEAALQAESLILITWSAAATAPERMVGTLHGIVDLPKVLTAVMDFPAWLERDSADQLLGGISKLRQSGAPFNIGIRTHAGDLLEADGRAAGTMSTLRFRPLAGQRLEASETQLDAHKLAKQVERLSGLLDAIPFPVWLTNKEGGLGWVNKAYVDATGVTAVDRVLKENLAFINPDSIDRSKADVPSHRIGRARAVFGGHKRAYSIHEMPKGDSTFSMAIDVTPLEEAERELERYVKAHGSTLDKLSTAIAIFGPDQRLRFHNQAYTELWQLEESYLAGQPADGEILDRLRQKRLLPEQANFREWRSKQLSAYAKLETREEFWYLPDGRSLRVVAEQHPYGGVSYLYENLTKERQLESRINELFDVQRETLDNLAEAIALSGPDGRIRLFNPAFGRFWNLDPAFLEKNPHLDEIARLPSLAPDAKNAWADIKYSITGLEANRKEHDGRIEHANRMMRYRAVPLPDGNALLTFTDVSDSSRVERALQDRAEALEAADLLKNRILTNVSYEVRTPLNSIIGFSDALSLGVAGPMPPKQSDYVSAIRRSSEELKVIIDAIIDLSAIDAGQMELKLVDVDVASLLEHSAEKFMSVFEKKNLELSVEMASDVDTLRADAERLEQVLGNLLSNAAGFTAPGGKIKLGARRQGDNLQIWVADSGRGIEPEFQSHVFDRFNSKPMPGSHRGPGLGLALVKSFVELHGGKVSLVSKLAHGTTVVCTLPLAGPSKGLRGATSKAA
ncbi:MAG: ATP-binding protein [Pseudomonadota bacterium]|nr:ATP-binding protein [Pseudomonadota bacterium]